MVEEGATNAMRLARRRQVLFRALAGKNDGLDVSDSELNLTNKNYPAGDVWRLLWWDVAKFGECGH